MRELVGLDHVHHRISLFAFCAHTMTATVSMWLPALLIALVLSRGHAATAAVSAQQALFGPEAVKLRSDIARTASAGLDPRLANALVEAAAVSEVNDVDAQVAIDSLKQSLLPWTNQTTILGSQQAPQWVATIPATPAVDPSTAQPVPPASSTTPCCVQLRAKGFRSNLPVVVIDTGGKVVPIRTQVPATFCVCGLTPDQDYQGQGEVQIRGSSSAVQEVKKSLGITFRGPATAAKPPKGKAANTSAAPPRGPKVDVAFLGMKPADGWALYGDNTDMTLGMRNALAYDLTRAMGRWAANVTFCEVFLVQDGEPLASKHYWGPYLAMEKIEIHPNRLNLTKLTARKRDLSGGYLLGYERSLWPDDIRVIPGQHVHSDGLCPSGDGRNLTYVLQDPSPQGAVSEQQGGPPSNDTRLVAWAASYLGSVEAALVAGTPPLVVSAQQGAQTGAGGTWRALVDEGAFIDYLFSQEVPKNPDANRGSVYFYKDATQPLVLGPPWDFNEAFGMCCGYPIEGYQNQGVSNGTSGGSAISPEGWRFLICDEPQRCVVDPVDGISIWWRSVWKRDPAFRAAVAARWRTLRQGPLTDSFFTNRFTFYQTQLRFAAPRNYIRWDAVLRPKYVGGSAQDTYVSSVQQMQDWTLARVRWMDQALAQVAAQTAQTPPVQLDYATANAVVTSVAACANRAAASFRA